VSSSANADDPVFRTDRDPALTPRRTGCLAFAEHDGKIVAIAALSLRGSVK
jgi:hypothetical protein